MEWIKKMKLPLVVRNVGKFFRTKSFGQHFDDALEFIAIILHNLGNTLYIQIYIFENINGRLIIY